jgi:hypothetical protein
MSGQPSWCRATCNCPLKSPRLSQNLDLTLRGYGAISDFFFFAADSRWRPNPQPFERAYQTDSKCPFACSWGQYSSRLCGFQDSLEPPLKFTQLSFYQMVVWRPGDGLDERGSGARFPAEAHLAQWVNWSEREAGHSAPFSTEVKNASNYTSNPPIHLEYFLYIVTYRGFAWLIRRVLYLIFEFIGRLYNWLQQFTNHYLTHCHLPPTGPPWELFWLPTKLPVKSKSHYDWQSISQ